MNGGNGGDGNEKIREKMMIMIKIILTKGQACMP
jgi:hypothetical protein